jgi:hypothetical protein
MLFAWQEEGVSCSNLNITIDMRNALPQKESHSESLVLAFLHLSLNIAHYSQRPFFPASQPSEHFPDEMLLIVRQKKIARFHFPFSYA